MIKTVLIPTDKSGLFCRNVKWFIDIHYNQPLEEYLSLCWNEDPREQSFDRSSLGLNLNIYDFSQEQFKSFFIRFNDMVFLNNGKEPPFGKYYLFICWLYEKYFLSPRGQEILFHELWDRYSDLFYNEVRDDFGYPDWFPFWNFRES